MKRILSLLLILPLLVTFTSCGDLSQLFDVLGDLQKPTDITLNSHQLDLIVGDSLRLHSTMSPDSSTQFAVAWSSDDRSIAEMHGAVVYGIAVGETEIHARSYIGWIDEETPQVLEDSCHVRVFDRVFDDAEYRYDMVVYAKVSVDGVDVTSDACVYAYVGDEIRGVSRTFTQRERSFLELRVYSKQPGGEMVSFKCNLPGEKRSIPLEQTLSFDGESHGTLSDLFLFTGSR